MSKPYFNPFSKPVRDVDVECRNCKFYSPFRTEEGYQDWVRGKCLHTGLSIVPPRHVCEAWKRKKGGEDEQ